MPWKSRKSVIVFTAGILSGGVVAAMVGAGGAAPTNVPLMCSMGNSGVVIIDTEGWGYVVSPDGNCVPVRGTELIISTRNFIVPGDTILLLQGEDGSFRFVTEREQKAEVERNTRHLNKEPK